MGTNVDMGEPVDTLPPFPGNEQPRPALGETGHHPPRLQPLVLRELVAAASAITTEAEAARVRRSGLLRQRAKAASALQELQRKVAAAQDEAGDWAARWTDRLAAAHLPANLPPGVASEAIALQAKLALVLEKIRELQRTRIATMQRDLDIFAAEAEALCASLAAEDAGLAPEEVARRLSRRLDNAERAKGFLERAVRDLAEAGKALQESRDRRSDAAAELAPLLAQAGVAGLEELQGAVDRSDRARALDAAIAAVSQLILEGGDGFGIDDLQREVTADDPATIRVRLEELERQREDARALRDRCLLAQKDAAAELGQIDGKDAAAEAEAQRQEALAAMAEATERFITVFVAGRLLRWVVERFRAERQDPLLLRASAVFRRLTVGSFEELSVDFDGDVPQLYGRRADHTQVGVDGMSEGTRDQLYLALRLAAIELHLDRVPPLPFIADDLFVNFDDGRAAAGLQALAELARRTQVIFLTHHRHLAEIAQEAVGRAVHITAI